MCQNNASPIYDEILGNVACPLYEEIQLKRDNFSNYTQCEAYGSRLEPGTKNVADVYLFTECSAYEKPQAL